MSITSIACWDSIIIIWGHSCVAIFFGYNANLDTFLTNDSSNGLPLETVKICPLGVKNILYSACVWSVMLHRSETWLVKEEDIIRIERNDAGINR